LRGTGHRGHRAGGIPRTHRPTQFDPASPYFDPTSKPESPRWLLVEVQVLQKTRNLTLPELRADAELADLLVLKKGNRLSITPVKPQHWQAILQRLGAD
jgi:predicted RNA-binding protein with PUA-like domain